MDELLTPIRTTGGSANEQLFVQAAEANKQVHSITRGPISSPDDALDALRSKPDFETLKHVLQYLDPGAPGENNINISIPGPEAAKLVNTLVGSVIPDYWAVLDKKNNQEKTWAHRNERTVLLRCLSSVSGLGAILVRLQTLIAFSKEGKGKTGNSDVSQHITDMLDIIKHLLKSTNFILGIWIDLKRLVGAQVKRIVIWKEFVSIMGGGKLLSTVAEALDIVNASRKDIVQNYWIASGSQYCAWIGRSAARMILDLQGDDPDAWKATAQLLGKSFGLGHMDEIVGQVYSCFILENEEQWSKLRALLSQLPAHERRNFFYTLLRIIGKRYFSSDLSAGDSWWLEDVDVVSSAAAVLRGAIEDSVTLKENLVAWLTNTWGGGVGEPIGIRRATIAAISQDEDSLQEVLEKSMRQFGDKLYIKHTPILHQEVNTQILLLAAGYVHRSHPIYLLTLARSSTHLSSVSNRLAASSVRSRFLGMVVGTAISNLIDGPDKKMSFGIDEMNSPEAAWYRSLTNVQDRIGSISSLETTTIDKMKRSKTISSSKTSRAKQPVESISKVVHIEEVLSDDEDDGLIPYEKPDSDEEDEHEDPTLVQRDKPTAPVYIRDLLSGLRDTENYDRQRLALSTAATLIRRKMNFGTEVSDHVEELAALLASLNDKYDMENLQEMRLQAMIALLVAQPLKMGQWFSKTFFDGDYSMGQRASILSTLGIGARELAGYKSEDLALTGAGPVPEFPSKKLPERLHTIYAAPVSPLDALSKRLERNMIAPMAAEVADKISGPDVLKVRTFSSRMEVEKRRKKPIANELAKIVADGFFFPLTGRWWVQLKTYGGKSVYFDPFLLTSYLKTLALILHASGPSTLSLPQMTSEFWDLLLSLRQQSDPTVLEALLFAMLTLLEINEDKRRLAEEHSKELLETQEWVTVVFEAAGGGGGGGETEGERVRMLAASLLMRIREVVEKYQRLLMGEMLDLQ